jgi:hypothetical protein
MRMLRSAMVGTILLTGTSGMMGAGQMGNGQMSSDTSMPGHVIVTPGLPGSVHKSSEIDPLGPELMERQERSRNSDRQKRLVADTDKLLELATNLKSQVDKTDKGAPPVDAAKKAEEIEKLAKSVRDRMKG